MGRPRGWSGLELTDTLHEGQIYNFIRHISKVITKPFIYSWTPTSLFDKVVDCNFSFQSSQCYCLGGVEGGGGLLVS